MTQELYALTSTRTLEFVLRFLDQFLPARSPGADDYPIPEFADIPSRVFGSDLDLISYLEANAAESYGIYWDDAARESCLQAMAFFTRDGMVILGLAGSFEDPKTKLAELAEFVGAKHACIRDEERPPETAREFIARCGPELR